ncbi:hypothetical protein BAUCODRAFT_361701 [Baudoinia panamericana UAMH 10762]|uniref:Uncharacterized protein n=1 Tax=Baudoinia panamericana (strain UAMH 10762) TaxID=717646 RepID=M2NLL0_BAUPA|nr:uncharacterized protein BAUCODRAFT_361701 [Baudoinia panamericana UAMH 10762]EMD00026.1 hypothetical protein BAUCODRAFT_361701 [Baudoinia panamericana UAMH 10762]
MAAELPQETGNLFVLPRPDDVETARSKLLSNLPSAGLGTGTANRHLRDDVVPGLNKPSQSSTFYGFVTGGVTPTAAFADNVVTEMDQNVQVHLPKETICTVVEDRATSMLCELLDFHPADWPHRTFTTGATASNVVGLALGRQFVIHEAQQRAQIEHLSTVADAGLFSAMKAASLKSIQILTTVPHSSLRKAASIVGLGRSSVVDISRKDKLHQFDLSALAWHLKQDCTASIVVISCAEVNTGLFATHGDDMRKIRELCDQYGAWLHVDAAFGLLARVLPESEEFREVKDGVAGLELADSIAGDAHKLLNVPYDCGIMLSKRLDLAIEVFQNPNAAYLNTASSETTASTDRAIPSPLNIGIENSRRFRALPVYATLAAYGRQGHRDMMERQIRLARAIAAAIVARPKYFELLPMGEDSEICRRLQNIYIIVLFRAKGDKLSTELVKRINSSRRIYISGTTWQGKPAARFAVASWRVDVERDLSLVIQVLDEVAASSTD